MKINSGDEYVRLQRYVKTVFREEIVDTKDKEYSLAKVDGIWALLDKTRTIICYVYETSDNLFELINKDWLVVTEGNPYPGALGAFLFYPQKNRIKTMFQPFYNEDHEIIEYRLFYREDE